MENEELSERFSNNVLSFDFTTFTIGMTDKMSDSPKMAEAYDGRKPMFKV